MPEGDAPLQGRVFCCTAVEPDLRAEITRQIDAMAGTAMVNLTSDVSYMIAGSRDTPKYEYAVKNRPDMKFLRPNVISELFNKWQSGEELDLTRELELGQLDVFEGLNICCTNISEGRDELAQLVQQYGGIYSPHLTKQVTHLVSGSAMGKKYRYAKLWEIFTIHPDWINHSVRRGAALREEYYEIEKPSDQIGAGAVSVWPDEYQKLQEEEEEKVAVAPKRVKKRKIESSQVWDTVLTENLKPKKLSAREAWEEREMPNIEDNELEQEPVKLELMFSGETFQFLGYDESKLAILQRVIKSHGGNTGDNATFCIVNSELAPNDRPEVGDGCVVATEWMIERSMHKKQLLMDEWGTLLASHRIPGMESLNIHPTGFSGIEMLHTPKLIKLLGGQHQDTLQPKPGKRDSTDLLVINSHNPRITDKIRLCKQNSIPMVNENWLFACSDRGILAPLDSEKFVMYDKPQPGKIIRRRSTDRDQVNDHREDVKENDPTDVQDISDKAKPKTDRRRLVGRAVTSNLTTNSESSRAPTPLDDESLHADEPQFTQVGYNDPEAAKDHLKLMEALGTSAKKQKTAMELKPAEENSSDRKRRLRKRN